jgi:hypothetical protein
MTEHRPNRHSGICASYGTGIGFRCETTIRVCECAGVRLWQSICVNFRLGSRILHPLDVSVKPGRETGIASRRRIGVCARPMFRVDTCRGCVAHHGECVEALVNCTGPKALLAHRLKTARRNDACTSGEQRGDG